MPVLLGVFILLLSSVLLLRAVRTGRLLWLSLFALVYGVGCAEFSTMILLMPLYGVVVLYLLWREERISVLPVSLLLVLGLIGLSVLFLAALRIRMSPAFAWREFESYWAVVRMISGL